MTNFALSFSPIVAGTRIGHVHLKVADLNRALAFFAMYTRALNLPSLLAEAEPVATANSEAPAPVSEGPLDL